MNKIIIALIGLALIATPALASIAPADIRVQLSTSGITSFKQQDIISGTDYWMPANGNTATPQPTAYVLENVKNVGTLDLVKQVTGGSNWGMQEDQNLWGTGFTIIKKEVVWWTVDTDGTNTGTLTYPTVTNIYTDTVAYDASGALRSIDEVHNTANQPLAMTPNSYTLNSVTTVPVYSTESVGINMPTRCVVLPPREPKQPTCLGCVR